jgi:hypothetical protein
MRILSSAKVNSTVVSERTGKKEIADRMVEHRRVDVGSCTGNEKVRKVAKGPSRG